MLAHLSALAVLFSVTLDVYAAPQSTESLVGRADQAAYLTPHNTERARHGATALTWSTKLESSAQSVANTCVFKHSGTAGVGENLAAGTGSFSPAAAINLWNQERSSYNPANPQPSHWTQVVWKSTTQVGCAVKFCSQLNGINPPFVNAQFYVCQYSPPGNVIGKFAENVQP